MIISCLICGLPKSDCQGHHPKIQETYQKDYWIDLRARIKARAALGGEDYDEEIARTTEHLLNLQIPPRRYLAPFPAYGWILKDGKRTFAQVGMHGCLPGEYRTLEREASDKKYRDDSLETIDMLCLPQ